MLWYHTVSNNSTTAGADPSKELEELATKEVYTHYTLYYYTLKHYTSTTKLHYHNLCYVAILEPLQSCCSQ
jgi:hypothetical protein